MSSPAPGRAVFRAVGSLWFAAVLLLLLMVAMGAATVHESAQGTEQAKAMFYHARWFRLLLVLLAFNIASAVAARFPLNRKQIPFLLAHLGILLMLVGALVTERIGVDGKLALAKGETRDEFIVPDEVVALALAGGAESSTNLRKKVGDGMSAVDRPTDQELALEDVRASVVRYAPDVEWERKITNDGAEPRLALELALQEEVGQQTTWILPGQHGELGGRHLDCRVVEDPRQWRELLGLEAAHAKGTVRVAYGGKTYELDVDACLEETVQIGDTPYALRVLRYLPHAVVGPDKAIVNRSDRPVNPAVEVTISGPEGVDTRLAFARFPDFHGRAEGLKAKDVKVSFAAPGGTRPHAPIEVVSGPEGRLAVRFTQEGADVITHELELQQVVDTPWPGRTFQVLQRYERARVDREAVEQRPVRKNRKPAVLVRVADSEDARSFWIQKHGERRFSSDGRELLLTYGDRSVPLGFRVTLHQFRIGYYPGGERARAYESTVRLTDPATGLDQSAVISMNNPASHGRYTLYQSSYQKHGDDYATVLSVARDPGLPIVFTGYAATMLGMVLLLGRRMAASRSRATRESDATGVEGATA